MNDMNRAVLKGYLIVILAAIAVMSYIFLSLFGSYIADTTKANMKDALLLMDNSIDYSSDVQKQIDTINPLVISKDSRITVISSDGRVIADTDPMVINENHSDRPEFRQALADEYGIDVRFSESLRQELLYAAKKSSDGSYILRVAVPYKGKLLFAGAMLPSVVGGAIVTFGIALVLASRLSKSITRPLREVSRQLLKIQNGDEKVAFELSKYDEINDIISAVKTMEKRVDSTMESIVLEKNKAKYVLDNMQEGLVLLDSGCNIVSINRSAYSMLGIKGKYEGENIVKATRNVDIINCSSDVVHGKLDEYNLNFETDDGRYISVKINSSGNKLEGIYAIILMVDNSEERENQTLRQEFFSNASHELKTPITSIKGYTELLTNKELSYTDEQRNEFLKRIKREADNMTSVINDILMISRLEAGGNSRDKSEFSLRSLLDEIMHTLSPQISDLKLSVNIECDDVLLNTEYQNINELLNNLISNAVKYNKPCGSLDIKIKYNDGKMNVAVKDTGIGIPKEAQSRVFERFYTVDKGRSKKNGGTGLGLAIVKHIVNRYKGTIKLISEVDKGTEIDVTIAV